MKHTITSTGIDGTKANSTNLGKSNPQRLAFAVSLIAVLISVSSLPCVAQTTVHQLSYNGKWIDQSLGVPLNRIDARDSAITAFITTPNNQKHVYFAEYPAGGYYNMHQETPSPISKTWNDENITQEAGGPNCSCRPTGFSIANQQYIFYESDNDNHIHLLAYNNVKWSDQDVTAAGHGSLPIGSTRLVAFPTTPNNQIHLFYTAAVSGGPGLGDIHQLFFNGVNWADEDLSAETGAIPTALPPIAGFSNGNYQYVFYGDIFSHLHEMTYNNISWKDVDLTARNGAPPVVAGGAAFVMPGTNALELFYHASSSIIWLSSADNLTWVSENLSTLTLSAEPDSYSLVAFPTSNNQIHVFYMGNSAKYFGEFSDVYQIYSSGCCWYSQNLTTDLGGKVPDPDVDIAGFAIGNQQFVYYVH